MKEVLQALEKLVSYTGWEPTTTGQVEIQELYALIKSHLQPDKDKLRDEIISELNEECSSWLDDWKYEYDENKKAFITTHKGRDMDYNIIKYYKSTNSVINLGTASLPLASKIIKYFELESE